MRDHIKDLQRMSLSLQVPYRSPLLNSRYVPTIDAIGNGTSKRNSERDQKEKIKRTTSFLIFSLFSFICAASAQAQPVGVWTDVTPANMDLVNTDIGGCNSFGVTSVIDDALHPSNLYVKADCQGLWKSTDYGQTWTGPKNASPLVGGVGGIAIVPNPAGQPPILYYGAIRGTLGLWKSVDDGASWTKLTVAVPGAREDLAPPVIDPYDSSHFIMSPHELNTIYQSFDAGQSWSNVSLDPGMAAGGSGGVFFINTSDAATTRNTWIWMAQAAGGSVGTWRTTNGGVSWTRVDSNEGTHGPKGFWQPDTSGVAFTAGVYSSLGWGV